MSNRFDSISSFNVQNLTDFTCPICGKKSRISDCTTFEQKDKTFVKEEKVITGVLGKKYLQTTEVYSAYKIRRCKKCTSKFWSSRKIAALICLIVLPGILAISKNSWPLYFASMLIGLIPLGIYNGLTWPKVDIEDAKRKNAIEFPKSF